jgi:hypothetical protein
MAGLCGGSVADGYFGVRLLKACGSERERAV